MINRLIYILRQLVIIPVMLLLILTAPLAIIHWLFTGKSLAKKLFLWSFDYTDKEINND